MADPMVLRRDFRVRLRPVHADLACAAIPSPSATGRHKQQSPAPEAHTRAHASSPGSPSPYTQPPHTSPKTLEREHTRLCCDYAALRLCCALYVATMLLPHGLRASALGLFRVFCGQEKPLRV